MAQQGSVLIYHNMAEAEDAVKRLIDQLFPTDQISIVMQNLETEKQVHGYITAGNMAAQGAGTGAWMGSFSAC
jgi:hypothetical protein